MLFRSTAALLAAATAWRRPVAGKVYDTIRAYVDAGNAVAAGSQPADLVWYRVHTVDLVWDIGQQAMPFQSVGAPTKVPDPPTGKYVLPAALASSFRPALGPILVIGAAIVLGAYLLRRHA